MRIPVKRPSGMPPAHVMRRVGTNSVTRSGKARPGALLVAFLVALLAWTVIFPSAAMCPSILSTVEFHCG
jgi:hypothetical protein